MLKFIQPFLLGVIVCAREGGGGFGLHISQSERKRESCHMPKRKKKAKKQNSIARYHKVPSFKGIPKLSLGCDPIVPH